MVLTYHMPKVFMDKIMSTSIDETVAEKINMIAKKLNITKKRLLKMPFQNK